MKPLATIDDLRPLFVGKMVFPESKVDELNHQLLLASDYLRIKFSTIDIEQKLEENEVAQRVVANIVASVVKRSYVSSVGPVGELEVSDYTQTAGDYSLSVSPSTSGSSFFLRRDELELLRNIFGIRKTSIIFHQPKVW